MFDTRPSRSGQLEVSGGRRVTAERQPVLCGSETVGALIRIAAPAAATGAPARRSRVAHPVGWVSLSAAQLGVANLVAAGLTNQQAAARLYLSPHTIDFHLRPNLQQARDQLESRARTHRCRAPIRPRERGVGTTPGVRSVVRFEIDCELSDDESDVDPTIEGLTPLRGPDAACDMHPPLSTRGAGGPRVRRCSSKGGAASGSHACCTRRASCCKRGRISGFRRGHGRAR